jgi:hypothetical protein
MAIFSGEVKGEDEYDKAKRLGLTNKDRYGLGLEHHPMSKRIGKFLTTATLYAGSSAATAITERSCSLS